MKVLVLDGGNSDERDISLLSGKNVIEALKNANHNVIEYDTANGLAALKDYVGKADAVFPILHGKDGEDGATQSRLEEIGFKYLGSDSKVSKLCFDKVVFKKELSKLGIATPNWEVVNIKTIAISPLLNQPYVLKPFDGGSSIDTYIIRDPSTSQLNLKDIFSRHREMLLEQLIDGVEITVPVLDKTALPVIEIIPPVGLEFDYENKYNGKTKELCPPENVDKELQKQAQTVSEKIHNTLGVRHLSRTDIIIDKNKQPYVLELNTMPGLTRESLFPKAAQVNHINMTQLVQIFLDMTLRDK